MKVLIGIVNEELAVTICFDNARYTTEDAEEFQKIFSDKIIQLINGCLRKVEQSKTYEGLSDVIETDLEQLEEEGIEI